MRKWNSERVGGEGNGNPLQYSCLENPMDGGARWATVHGVAKSETRLSDFTFTFHFHALEKEMATHSSTLAWRIPWVEEPGGLQSTGSQRVGHNWATSLSLSLLIFNMLSSLVKTFFPRSKRLLISWLQSPSTVILESPQNKVWQCFHFFPIYFPWCDGTRCHDVCFLNVEI